MTQSILLRRSVTPGSVPAAAEFDAHSLVLNLADGLLYWRDSNGTVRSTDLLFKALAKLASPVLTGTPTAPTAAAGTSSTQLATTAFVASAIAALQGAAPATLDTIYEIAAQLQADESVAASLATAVGNRLRGDAAGGYTAGQVSQFLSNLGISSFIKTLLDDGDDATARGTLGAQAALGFVPVEQGGGANQGTAKIKLGIASGGTAPRLQADATDFGNLWCDATSALNTGDTWYLKLPNGLIFQGSTVTVNAGDFTATFPLAFVSACFGVWAAPKSSVASTTLYSARADGWTKTTTNIRSTIASNGGSVASQPNLPVTYFAIGA